MKFNTPRAASYTLVGILVTLPLLSPLQAQPDRPILHGAANHGGDSDRRSANFRPRDPADMLEQLDTDADGKISFEEFLGPRLARLENAFEARDRDRDGLISADEDRPPAADDKARRPDRARRPALANIDQDAVAACVRESIPDFDPPARPDADDLDTRFDAADSNGDGKLSLAELSASMESRLAARFDQLDADVDGFISADEAEALRAQQREMRSTLRACARELRRQ